MSDLTVRRASLPEAGALGRLVAESFRDLPVSRWLVADPVVRADAMGAQFAMLIAHGIRNGVVYTVGPEGSQLAASVWFEPGETFDIPGYDERLAAVCGPHLARFVELDELMHKAHPTSPDHVHLSLMAVAESERNRGIGSRVLEEHHTTLDKAGIPAYLDASGPPARRLYLRHGYVDAGEAYGPEGVKEFLPMWREPA